MAGGSARGVRQACLAIGGRGCGFRGVRSCFQREFRSVVQIPDEGTSADHDDEKQNCEKHSEKGFHGWILFVFDSCGEGTIGLVAEG